MYKKDKNKRKKVNKKEEREKGNASGVPVWAADVVSFFRQEHKHAKETSVLLRG